MSTTTGPGTVHDAAGVFDIVESLRAAIGEFESSGFDRAEFSLLAGAIAAEGVSGIA